MSRLSYYAFETGGEEESGRSTTIILEEKSDSSASPELCTESLRDHHWCLSGKFKQPRPVFSRIIDVQSEDEENKDRSIHCSRRGEQSRREPSVESQAPSRRETCFLATSLLVYQLVTEHRSRNINFSADISSSKGARETNTAAHIDDVI